MPRLHHFACKVSQPARSKLSNAQTAQTTRSRAALSRRWTSSANGSGTARACCGSLLFVVSNLTAAVPWNRAGGAVGAGSSWIVPVRMPALVRRAVDARTLALRTPYHALLHAHGRLRGQCRAKVRHLHMYWRDVTRRAGNSASTPYLLSFPLPTRASWPPSSPLSSSRSRWHDDHV